MKKRVLAFLSAAVLTLTAAPLPAHADDSSISFKYPRQIVTDANYQKPIDESLWDRFLKYDLCITNYDALTEEEKDLCRFIFETECSANDTVVCARARAALAGCVTYQDRLTLADLSEPSWFYDRNAQLVSSPLEASSAWSMYVGNNIPDIRHLDSVVGVDEYWLDDAGRERFLCEGWGCGWSYDSFGYCCFDSNTGTWTYEGTKLPEKAPLELMKNGVSEYRMLPDNTLELYMAVDRTDMAQAEYEALCAKPFVVPDTVAGYWNCQ